MSADILARIEDWRTRLLDVSKRNRLISFKAGRSGGIRFLHPDSSAIWQRLVIASSSMTFVRQRDLVPASALPAADPASEPSSDFEDGADPDLLLVPAAPANTVASTASVEPAEPTPPPAPPEGETWKSSKELLRLCLESKKLGPRDLLTEFPDELLSSRLGRLHLTARTSESEQGVGVLFVAFGFLRWFESRESRDPVLSPLLLVPVKLDREHVEAPWKLFSEDDEVLPNFTLAQLLQTRFRISLPTDLDPFGDLDDEKLRFGYFDAVRERIKDCAGWEVTDEVALGAFSFQKLAIWDDLGRNAARIAEHPLCRAIAGDRSALPAPPENRLAPADLDEKTDPATTWHILDADSSQHAAIAAATAGASLVIDGPPGTGKSQTIANLIAEFLAAGKKVLFVSEKTAALEVVKRRLDQAGLGDFCLELHSHKANKKAVLEELNRALGCGPIRCPDGSAGFQELAALRKELDTYARELHIRREPIGLSVHEISGLLAGDVQVRRQSRCRIDGVLQRDHAYLDRVVSLAGRLSEVVDLVRKPEAHPWRGCKLAGWSLTLRDDTAFHLRRVVQVLPNLRAALGPLAELAFCSADPTMPAWREAGRDARAVLDAPALPAEWLGGDLRRTLEATLRLEELSRLHRDLPSLPDCFTAHACRQVGSAKLNELARGVAALPTAAADSTVRSWCSERQRLPALARQSAEGLAEFDRLTNELFGRLAGKVKFTETGRLFPLAQALEDTSDEYETRRVWWDDTRREELSTMAHRAEADSDLASSLRAALVARLSPEAFIKEHAEAVRELSLSRSVFRWLSPRWWKLNALFNSWYRQLPDAAERASDLVKLAAWHQLQRFLDQTREAYGPELIGEGVADWAEIRSTLEDFEAYVVPLRLPAGFKKGLASPREADRQGLATLKTELCRNHRRFREAWQELPLLPILPDATLASLRDRLTTTLRSLDAEATLARGVEQLLAAERDLPFSSLAGVLKNAAEWQARLEEAERLRDSAKVGGAEDGPTLLARDWSAQARLAREILPLLEGRSGDPAGRLVALQGSPEKRRRLEDTLAAHEKLRDARFEESWRFATESVFEPGELERDSLSALEKRLQGCLNAPDRLQEWVRYHEIERGLLDLDLASLLDEVRNGDVEAGEAATAFRQRFYRLWLDAVAEGIPVFRSISAEVRDQKVQRFRELDQTSIRLAASRIRQRLLNDPHRVGCNVAETPEGSEMGLLLHEIGKKRRHLPLRRLFTSIPTILTRLKPCLMMSPLSVSAYLLSDRYHFDLVIFDEASQVRPHDAICAVYRGRQLVVAGDQKQLPPTSFFERAGEEAYDDEDAGLAEYESILDVCCTLGLTRRRLRWHYRSRREALIAFANQMIYDGELVTFPSARDSRQTSAVEWRYVADGRWLSGRTGGINRIEAKRIAEEILEHFRSTPDRSLGVIAFSQRQQECILDELEKLRRQAPDLETHFAGDRVESFFVKNLENVQGDERDVIFLGIGYGPDPDGKVAMRFGPLNRVGGERRLNVAITRARQRMRVFSSLKADDIDPSRTDAAGALLLRRYLDYAENGPSVLEQTEEAPEPESSSFEQAVAEELRKRGVSTHARVGCGGLRVDLGILDPSKPGRYLLGLECEGSSFRALPTARDRERLRATVLEDLEWNLCRVWSAEWLQDQERQIQRILKALQSAGKSASRPARAPSRESLEQPMDRKAILGKAVNKKDRSSIEQVPADEIRDEILNGLNRYGSMTEDDLIRHVAQRIGFQRVGPRIREGIVAVMQDLQTASRIQRGTESDKLFLA